MPAFNESTVENPAPSLFGEIGYVYHHGSDMTSVDLVAGLIQISVPNMGMHIRNVFVVGELQADSVVKEFLTTGADGKSYAMQRLTFVTSGEVFEPKLDAAIIHKNPHFRSF